MAERARFGFSVSVLSSDLPVAREILEKLLNQESEDVEIPAFEGEVSSAGESAVTEDQTTTCEIWAGEDGPLAGFLRDALRENEIPVRVQSASSKIRVFVPASAEARAREIIREVVEGAPPH